MGRDVTGRRVEVLSFGGFLVCWVFSVFSFLACFGVWGFFPAVETPPLQPCAGERLSRARLLMKLRLLPTPLWLERIVWLTKSYPSTSGRWSGRVSGRSRLWAVFLLDSCSSQTSPVAVPRRCRCLWGCGVPAAHVAMEPLAAHLPCEGTARPVR